MGSCVLRETILKRVVLLRAFLYLSIYLSVYLSFYIRHLVDEQLQALGRASSVPVHESTRMLVPKCMMARFAKTRGRGSPLPLKLEHTRWRAGMEMPWLSAPAMHARRVDSLYSVPAQLSQSFASQRPRWRLWFVAGARLHDAWDIGLTGSAHLIGIGGSVRGSRRTRLSRAAERPLRAVQAQPPTPF